MYLPRNGWGSLLFISISSKQALGFGCSRAGALTHRQGQLTQAPQCHRAAVFELGLGVGQLETWKFLKHGFDRDRAFQSRQRRAQAEVNSLSERDVVVGLTGHVEAFRPRELCGVAVSCRQKHEGESASRNLRSSNRGGRSRHPYCHLDRRVVAQHFLDGGRNQPAVLAKTLLLIGVSTERQQTVANEIGGSFVSGQQ